MNTILLWSVLKWFCEDLDSGVTDVTRSEKLLILGFFNARAGTDYQAWKGTTGEKQLESVTVIACCNSDCSTHMT